MEQDGEFSLSQLQNWMQGMLVQHVPVANGNIQVAEVVNSSEKLSAERHLSIYRQSYIARLRACMQSQFSSLAYALGSDLFELFADQYLNANPSESYTLNTLGAKFADFLEATRPDADQDEKESWPDFMIELARFEYALSEIFDQPAAGNYIEPGEDTPDELLKMAPVFQLFHHSFPVCRYYLDFSQDKKPELPFPEESFCAVSRRDYKLGLFVIRGAQYYFLQFMQQGKTVSNAKDELLKAFNFDEADFQRVWPEWRRSFIASGFLCAIT